ncbi:hypothetical protein [Neomegalonema sp.]|uniref:hypothetical protein n=1 Tax=Neomegalonema sp. TaxID=2039713 RepID=UPI00260C2498|nr:hypothetical protein [Neomegalonema sp.]MDD2869639.1 hypothetical protein [Neomegalonema sp.]
MTFEEWVEKEFPHKDRPPYRDQFLLIENILKKAWDAGYDEAKNRYDCDVVIHDVKDYYMDDKL